MNRLMVPPLAGGVPPLEHQDQPGAHLLDPVLHLHQLHLQAGQFLFVEAAIEAGTVALPGFLQVFVDGGGVVAIGAAGIG